MKDFFTCLMMLVLVEQSDVLDLTSLDSRLDRLKLGETLVSSGIKVEKISLGIQDPTWVPFVWSIEIVPPDTDQLINRWNDFCMSDDPVVANVSSSLDKNSLCPVPYNKIETDQGIYTLRKRFFGMALASAAMGAAGYATWRAETNKQKINEVVETVNKVTDDVKFISSQNLFLAQSVLNLSTVMHKITTDQKTLMDQVDRSVFQAVRNNINSLAKGINDVQLSSDSNDLQQMLRAHNLDMITYKTHVANLLSGKVPETVCVRDSTIVMMRQELSRHLPPSAPIDVVIMDLCQKSWRLVKIKDHVISLATELVTGNVISPLFKITPLPFIEGDMMLSSPPEQLVIFVDMYSRQACSLTPRPGFSWDNSRWLAIDDSLVMSCSFPSSHCYHDLLSLCSNRKCNIVSSGTSRSMILMNTGTGCLWVSGGGSLLKNCTESRDETLDIKAHTVICPDKECQIYHNDRLVLDRTRERQTEFSYVYSGLVGRLSGQVKLESIPAIIRSPDFDATAKEIKEIQGNLKEGVSVMFERTANMSYKKIKVLDDIVDLQVIQQFLNDWKGTIIGSFCSLAGASLAGYGLVFLIKKWLGKRNQTNRIGAGYEYYPMATK